MIDALKKENERLRAELERANAALGAARALLDKSMTQALAIHRDAISTSNKAIGLINELQGTKR